MRVFLQDLLANAVKSRVFDSQKTVLTFEINIQNILKYSIVSNSNPYQSVDFLCELCYNIKHIFIGEGKGD